LLNTHVCPHLNPLPEGEEIAKRALAALLLTRARKQLAFL
jgi:hypothetical protein